MRKMWLGREIVVVSFLPSMRGLGGKERNGKDGVMIWGGIVRDEEEWERWKMEGWVLGMGEAWGRWGGMGK